MDTDIPDAAIERAIKECQADYAPSELRNWGNAYGGTLRLAILNHARLIAKYEPETLVDPLTRTAIDLVEQWTANPHTGVYVCSDFALICLRRGIEIAKANPDGK